MCHAVRDAILKLVVELLVAPRPPFPPCFVFFNTQVAADRVPRHGSDTSPEERAPDGGVRTGGTNIPVWGVFEGESGVLMCCIILMAIICCLDQCGGTSSPLWAHSSTLGSHSVTPETKTILASDKINLDFKTILTRNAIY